MALATSGDLTVIILDSEESDAIKSALKMTIEIFENKPTLKEWENEYLGTLNRLYWEIW